MFACVFGKKRGLRSGSLSSTSSSNAFAYPYPRTHTTVMVRGVVPSPRPFAPEDDPRCLYGVPSYTSTSNFSFLNNNPSMATSAPRPRPPLNRACPPIPESKSNESIMTHASSSAADKSPMDKETPGLRSADDCVVIENRMAAGSGIPTSVSQQSIGSGGGGVTTPIGAAPANANRQTGIPRFTPRPPTIRARAEPPRSPLMSVAHSVRSRLSKLGNRFGRADSPGRETRNIRGSQSMTSMPSTSRSKLPKLVTTDQNDNVRAIQKSSSMDAPVPSKSASSDSLKQIAAAKRGDCRTAKPSHLPLPRTTASRIPCLGTRPLEPIFSEDSEIESSKAAAPVAITRMELLKKTKEVDEVSVPSLISPDPKDLVSRFVDDSTTTAERRESIANQNVEPDELTVAEEIPMDTQQTPDGAATIPEEDEMEDENDEVAVVVVRVEEAEEEEVRDEILIGEDTITVVREQTTTRVAPPVFIAPAPPTVEPPTSADEADEEGLRPPRDVHKSSSEESSDTTLKENCKVIYIQRVEEVREKMTEPAKKESSKERKERKDREKAEKKAEKEQRDKEREKTPRTPLTTRSIKSFLLRKNSEKAPKTPNTQRKPPPTSRSMPFSPSRSRLSLPMRRKHFAPLAEFESTVVENSPAVEQMPAKWGVNGTPPRARRNSERSVKELLREAEQKALFDALRAGDSNGNVDVTASPRLFGPQHSEQHRGLIDDEILDQPMLMGDYFPTSESMERMKAFEVEKDGLISIDRSIVEESEANHLSRRANAYENGNEQHFQPSSSTRVIPSVYGNVEANIAKREKEKTLEAGLSEVDDIRSQLIALQSLVQSEMQLNGKDAGEVGDHKQDFSLQELVRENDALRRQLLERDAVIKSLRNQLGGKKLAI